MKIDAKESLPRFAIYLMLVAFVMVTCLVIMPSEASATSWPVAVDSDCPDGAEEGDVCGEESVTGTCQGSFPGDTELTCTADTSDPTAEDDEEEEDPEPV
ncbi:MAG: hypothetical protein U9Q03_05955, partial [Patescibacteria group bacterium]|nr:hypothetical protein [Patescibacteria group bacterium]